MSKKVIIRADASIWIGSGHIMRCLTLADELSLHGYSVEFCCIPQPGDMCHYVEQRGYHVTRLSMPRKPIEPKGTADYLAWLQRSVDEDIHDFLDKISAADWVITDHYAIGKKWQQVIKKALDCRMLAIDDLVRKHCADIIVDQTLNRQAGEYEANIALTGIDFALLDPSFHKLRARARERTIDQTSVSILVSMGGIDLPNATLMVLEALRGLDLNITVLLSERSPHYKLVKSWCEQNTNVIHIAFTSNMAEMMLEHDIAIGAPGSTSWERACLGLPSIIIPLAENQYEICAQLVKSEVAFQININDISIALKATLKELVYRWPEFHQNSLNLCDGFGTQRVVKKIIELDK